MDSSRERHLRQSAKKLGILVQKRDNGYMLIDARTNGVIAGSDPVAYSLSIDQAEEEIRFWQEKADKEEA